MKILHIEDDYVFADVLKDALEENNKIKVKTVNPSGGLFSIIDDFQPNVILLDIFRGKKSSGINLLDEIKKSKLHRHIPVIILSGINNEDVYEKCFSIGAFDYLFKPVPLGTLLKSINRATELNERN